MTEQELLSLVFESGVSTSPLITEISGRGLGLAIVRERVASIGGEVSLETRLGRGTTFRIVLPVSMATFRGLVVRSDERLFVLPLANVERALRVSRKDIKTVENRETLELDGKTVSFVRLAEALELRRKKEGGDANGKMPVVVLRSGEARIAFQTDEVLSEQEVLAKGLGPQLARVPNVTGAALLGTGKAVPILNVADLIKSAVKVRAVGPAEPATPLAGTEKIKSILLAEDSITARTLLKGILEAAGYRVKAAVDGTDALAALRSEEFDLLVSDVDMPRMNGFDLTAKIRGDKKLSDLPIILITALESREDRERGIFAGANAYIVKRSFDEGNLLEVIRRLI